MNRAYKYSILFAVLAGVFLPPETLVNWALPAMYREYAPGYIHGIWLLKAFLVVGGLLLWIHARRNHEFWRSGVPTGMPPTAFARWEYVLLGLVILGSVALRLPGLDGSLTFDEVFLVRALITQNPIKMFFHPSGSAHLLHTLLANGVMRVMDVTPWAARLPAFLLGALTPLILYLAIRRILSRPVAVIAALILALTPVHVWYSQEAKGNSPLMFGVVLSWWFLSRLAARWNSRDAAGYLVALLVVGLSHLSGMMFVGVVGLALLIVPRRMHGWLGDTALVGKMIYIHLVALWLILLVYAPIMPFLVERGGTGYLTEGAPRFVVLGREMLGQFTALDQAWPWLVAPALLLFAGAISMCGANAGLFLLLTLPLAIDLIITVTFKLFSFPRYHMYFLPVVAVLMATGITGLWARACHIGTAFARLAAAIVIAILVHAALAGYGLAIHHYYGWPKSNYAATARLIAARPDSDPVYVVGHGRKGYPASGLVFYTNRFETDDTIGPVLSKTDSKKMLTVVVLDPLHAQVSYPDLLRHLKAHASSMTIWPCHGELDQYRVRSSLVFEIPAGVLGAQLNR